ncbi:methyltransferase [Cryomorpha ignava]|uniref:Methyltransferase n=1 Tax=Cryomorpha ignava TaxID=101383 RepID=A0A7K3WKE5_9FLAO|nr:class I SAM-dependent methyltransferase [Cryomorpha ignava]NEN22123.1 methyltransferase [Cryomorpha ignava]
MENSLDYELIDFGNGRKLERFGKCILNRPEILANKPKTLSNEAWQKMAHGQYSDSGKETGKWININDLPAQWLCEYASANKQWTLELTPGKYKHVGVFPEQEKHWKYLEKHVKPGHRVLNLFGYTGASSLASANAGGDVFHVDSSKSVIKWAARNAQLSDVSTIHWVCDDALKFAERELKRGSKYDFIIMDPPVFGQGKKGVRWKLENLLPQLVKTTTGLLNKGGILILNTYSPVVSLEEMEELMVKNSLNCTKKGWLSVSIQDGRRLNLSKYTIAKG